MSTETLVERMQNENDFSKYIDLLAEASIRYSIFITSNDTPCGSSLFTKNLALKMCHALGTKILLHDKMRCAYLVAISEGCLLSERIAQNSSVEFSCVINENEIYLKSESFRGDRNINSITKINGIDYTPLGSHYNCRGLNIIVFDVKKNVIIDRVNFDTYSGIRASDRTSLKAQDIYEFYAKHPNVVFMRYSTPSFPAHSHSKNERYIIKNSISRATILENADNSASVLNEYIHDSAGIYEVLSPPRSYIGTNGAKTFFDKQGRYVNIVNGHRITIGQPENPKRSIWFLGTCETFGVGCRDEGTVESFLQAFLNEYAATHYFIVHNYGHYLWGDDNQGIIFSLLKTLPIKSGDIVFNAPRCTPAAVVDCSQLAIRPHNLGELFWDLGHITERCQLLIAKAIFETLQRNEFFTDYKKLEIQSELPLELSETVDTQDDYGLSPKQLELLEMYKSSLSTFYEQQFGNNYPPPPPENWFNCHELQSIYIGSPIFD